MATKVKIQSVEPNIADLANGWLKSYKLDYKLEQESLNTEIDQALNEYYSKNGGVGGNRPDAKMLLRDKNLCDYPILIEYKGYKDKLVKLDNEDKVANKTTKGTPDYKNINSYAVNGAVHYANAILHYTSFTGIIAIGMTGFKNDSGKLEYSIGVYYVSKSNFGIGQKVDEYTDFSFLKQNNFDSFIEKIKRLQLKPEEIEKLKEQLEAKIKDWRNGLTQAERYLTFSDYSYLAMPRNKTNLVNLDMLQNKGIGLLSVEGSVVEEIICPIKSIDCEIKQKYILTSAIISNIKDTNKRRNDSIFAELD